MARQELKALVTGGAGFLGTHLVRALAAAGYTVRVLDDLSRGRREGLAGVSAELLQADVRSLKAVRRAMEGVDLVFHLAGTRAPLSADEDGDLQRSEEVNVGGTLNVLQAAREARPRRVVVTGDGQVYGKAAAYLLHEEIAPVPTTLHAVQQLAIEHHLRVYRETYQVPAVLIRLFPTFGPGEAWEGATASLVPRLCRAALEGSSPVIVGDPRQTRDFVYVDNVVAALISAALTAGIDGEVFNVASGEAATLGQVWALLCELAGRKRNQLEPTYTPSPPWDVTNMRVSIARACRTLGYAPAVRLREGLRRTMEHYLATWNADPNAWFSPASDEPRVEEAATGNAWFSGPTTATATASDHDAGEATTSTSTSHSGAWFGGSGAASAGARQATARAAHAASATSRPGVRMTASYSGARPAPTSASSAHRRLPSSASHSGARLQPATTGSQSGARVQPSTTASHSGARVPPSTTASHSGARLPLASSSAGQRAPVPPVPPLPGRSPVSPPSTRAAASAPTRSTPPPRVAAPSTAAAADELDASDLIEEEAETKRSFWGPHSPHLGAGR